MAQISVNNINHEYNNQYAGNVKQKKMAGRVPLENVSEKKKENKMDARGSDDGS
jgi:hypothetical protein